jgi:hypothetical protein
VVAVICDAACNTLHAVPLEAVNLVAERLHDKSVCIPLIDIIVFQTFSLFLTIAFQSQIPVLLYISSNLLKSIPWRDWPRYIEFFVRKALTPLTPADITGFLGRSLDVSMIKISGEQQSEIPTLQG